MALVSDWPKFWRCVGFGGKCVINMAVWTSAAKLLLASFNQVFITDNVKVKMGGRAPSGLGGKGTTRKYKSEWEKTFLWVRRDPVNPYAAYCKYCKSSLQPKKDTLADHANSERHK